MSEKPLIIDSNPPAMVVAHSDRDFGVIDLNIVGTAIDDAQQISFGAESISDDSEQIQLLKQQIRGLADTVTQLAGQLYQLGHAVEVGRIAVFPREF